MWLVNKNLTKTQIFLNGNLPQFSPQNTGNRLLGLCNFTNFSEGACPQTPLENSDCWYNRLLYSNLLATSIFIETFEASWKWWFGGVWQDFENWPSFGLVMELSKNFTVRSPKCHSDDKHHKTTWNRWFRGVRQYLEIGNHMGYFLSPNQNFTEIYHYN